MLGVFAEFETNLRKERQTEGIAKAKATGVYEGRPPSVDQAKVTDLKGFGPSQIARKLGISRASVYRALGAIDVRPPLRSSLSFKERFATRLADEFKSSPRYKSILAVSRPLTG